ncbi:ATP-binding protein [Erwinia oleae]|uniref:ATP-binding protein n=1 Tax=Erwinia oleae TaxID=796334 RepID=UPI0006912ED8|nr:AAA family ATPase [Erwinia oleae]
MLQKRPSVPLDEVDTDFYQRVEHLDLLLTRLYYKKGNYPNAELAPFMLPEGEIEYRLANPVGIPHWLAAAPPYMVPLDADSLSQRLSLLCRRFSLTDSERDILLAGLLTTLSPHYQQLFTQLHQNGNHLQINGAMLLEMLPQTLFERRMILRAIEVSSPLFRYSLLVTGRKENLSDESFQMMTHPSIWQFLHNERELNPSLRQSARWLYADKNSWAPVAMRKSLPLLWPAFHDENIDSPPVLIIEGNASDAAAQAMTLLLNESGLPTLLVKLDNLNKEEKSTVQERLVSFLREVTLHNGCLLLVIDNSELNDELLKSVAQATTELKLHVAILCHSEESTTLAGLFQDQCVIHLPFTAPSGSEKTAMLKCELPAGLKKNLNLDALGQRYTFYPHLLPQILNEAANYRLIRDGGSVPGKEDLIQALNFRSQKNFGKLAQRISPKRTFDDLVLAPGIMQQLKEIVAAITYREDVSERYFSRKLAGKLGVSALFYGESGTGKTLAAEVLAAQLNTDLVKVDLSTVVNKFVGETEKNLARIFDLAAEDSGVLFFDEADALFGKRTESKDAHDRHANIEVSYLLQRLESYPGLVILATNNRNHLDSAFNRRFTFITRFTYPDAALRATMWQRIWPANLPLADDINPSILTNNGNLTGANIRNIALLAAILAKADKADVVSQHHLELALKRELGKAGRPSLLPTKE